MLGKLFFGRKNKDLPPSDVGGNLVYAIGDVHGRSDLLDGIIINILKDVEETGGGAIPTVVFVGDYIDRGPASGQVIKRVIQLAEHVDVRPLRGNHEHWMLEFLDDASFGRRWLKRGGEQTLAAYGVLSVQDDSEQELERVRADLLARVPPSHIAFLNALSDYTIIGDYLFVHAGIRPNVPLENQELEDILSIRMPFLRADQACGHVVVHGHTPELTPINRRWRIGIDTGAYATGVLTAVRLFGTDRRFLQTCPSEAASLNYRRP